jgi:hypothetical protein
MEFLYFKLSQRRVTILLNQVSRLIQPGLQKNVIIRYRQQIINQEILCRGLPYDYNHT